MAPQAKSRDTSWNLLAQAMGPWVWDCAEGLCQRLCQDCAGFLPLASCLLRGWKHSETPTVSLAFLFLLCFSLGMSFNSSKRLFFFLGRKREGEAQGARRTLPGSRREVTTCSKPVGVAFEALTTAL